MELLVKRLPKYENQDNLPSWVGVNRAYVAKRIDLEKRGLLLPEEKKYLAEAESSLNAKIKAYNELLTPDRLATEGVPVDAFEKIAAERAGFLYQIELVCGRRSNVLYGNQSRKSNRKSKLTVKAMIDTLDFDSKFYVFGPWAITGVPAPELPERCFTQKGAPIRTEVAKVANAAARSANNIPAQLCISSWLGSLAI